MSVEHNSKVETQVKEADALRLSKLTQTLLRGRGVRHALVGIGTGRGDPLWVGAEGSADGDESPMTPETPFFLASVTKLYIATSIFRLMERGELQLDSPMAQYLPQELVSGIHRMKKLDQTRDITVRHLLGHTSGLPEYLVLARKGEASIFDRVGGDLETEWGIREICDLLRDAGRPHHSPHPIDGKRHTIRYSDTNFQLLIAILEEVRGAPLHEVFEEFISGPLGLTRTFLPGTPAAEAVTPPPARFWAGNDLLDDRPGPLRSFRDLYSTAHETLRFMSALIHGELYEDPATVELMRAHFNPLAFSLNPRPTGPGWPIEYGLGMIRFRMPRLFTGFRQAPTLFGHTGVTGSWLFHVPKLDLILTGTVDQVMGAPVPYRFGPRLALELEALGISGPEAP